MTGQSTAEQGRPAWGAAGRLRRSRGAVEPFLAESRLTGAGAHLLACHNPVRPGEPRRENHCGPGFRPAPPPPELGPVTEETA